MNPLVFIVGCPRSGTTLLQRIVAAHPHLAITPETHWIPSFFKKQIGLSVDGCATSEIIDALLAFHTFAKLGLAREDLSRLLEGEIPVSFADFVSGIYDLYGATVGKSLVGDKTPGYARHVPLLHELWPRAKFVHLIRDGRDACLSLVAWKKAGKLANRFATWREHPIVTAALFWQRHVELCQAAGRSLEPGLYHEMRYESLVDDPAREVDRLCNFLGVPYDERMLHYHEGRTRNAAGLDAKHAWLPITPGLRDWRTQMPGDDVERFEAAVGAMLEKLDYPRAYRRPRMAAMREAEEVRGAFSPDFRSYAQRASLSEKSE
jgi:hypothetical protein